ncbi:hydroxyacid dehydrogenase [Candidatus Halobonum tyrrellensis]|uniref:D-isomer specific 2-hydroxyacid dehydrogenase NAD-binding protein n=1 Tax=Candidatus Halobonum tyrrellensis G22 TaxID=1324957 RepID=V4IXU5_9EURY|nr:hydroxyacid dehydrogenase [Candidatus Halobonum tyrrellensis]ESP87982.1 D-isomer specific 2-hydroxyacid dehydrogenase NAD-binding protein [Candidatus Halobonum tyrrellensis G22]
MDATDERWAVLLPDDIDPVGPESIADIASFTRYGAYADRAALVADADRFDAMVVRLFEVPADLLDAATNLKVVANHGAGVDNVDVDAATRNGVPVCNTPGVNARAVAEHAVMLLLAVKRRLVPADAHVRDGGWDRGAFAGSELAGETVGLLGVGDIGAETARVLAGFDVDLLTYDPYVPAGETPAGVEPVDTLAALFERADAVSVHTPLTDETQGLVGADELAALGPDGVFVNTARGGVVDAEALTAALDRGELAGAGLDTFDPEPPDADDPPFGRDDVVVTPHVAGVTDEALARMSRAAAENVRTVYEGGLPESTVNADALADRGRR